MPSRRQYLGIIAGGGATAAVVSGALAVGANEDDPERLAESTINTTGADCGGPDLDEAHVTIEDDRVEIDGLIRGPDPCQHARLDRIETHGETLLVEIGLESAVSENEPCVECVGEIAYEATVPVAESIDSVDVFHEDRPVDTT